MLPYQTLLPLQRGASPGLPQQIAAGLIDLIRRGVLPFGARFPGARQLAGQLGVNRQTVGLAYEELQAQGWLVQRPRTAPVVCAQLPEVPGQPLPVAAGQFPARAAFQFTKTAAAPAGQLPAQSTLVLDGGSPDARLVPHALLARNYRLASRGAARRPHLLGYAAPNGVRRLREQLARYLHDTRGVPATADHVFVTRGSTMAFFLLAQLLVQAGDTVVVAARSYAEADAIFQSRGARLARVAVDEHGLVLDELEVLCRRQPVRLLYVTPHHHYPTTVTLSAARRVRLLALAEQYDFIVLEDDYDFDYHYAEAPILPLASADRRGRVIYTGSLSKVLAPAYRIGYVVAPAEVLAALAPIRVLVDQLGDPLLETAVAELLADGTLHNHLARSRQQYQHRRDVFCAALQARLAPWFTFVPPAGGLAVWGRFAAGVDLPKLAQRCQELGLLISDGRAYQLPTEPQPSHLRLGFAVLTPAELERSVRILETALRALH
ncbi:MocR-like pyridoxine biosynthesis transcription factor PdxR [Hymenobacter rigui]|uniref:PLP-dependent aminotransferase family protein n=1 Tax=Hymenobacter rigui TaxID=334424 RepID=A0A3R9N3S8_9BACT|nr:PLP-dependent aminotransferase family protein [Hymenobacter rigui]RSK47521.1 PLP-dependent aminotransferase family protein [Hymenobacter rigui]